ncbi:AraC family transcriptional regulator [Ferrimonas sp. YFM]|uniref:AraC family transcriptional regulator n=1 Tax=Ferrimonas sp. YFM TaxID=3028878 RepID=UPI002573203E|nr:AraC family transcriptional regulator [Ferrimonas sp. YFM]BDY04698.1 AraC family transcriptional regulator [Ferrimonas sp. YFM]
MKQATKFAVHRGWQLLLTDMGMDAAEVLRLAGLPGDLFSRNDAHMTTSEYYRLWDALEQLAGARQLPLMLANAISAEAFDAPIFAALCSDNLNHGFSRLSQFKRLIGPLTLKVEIGEHRTRAIAGCYGYPGQLPRALALTEMVFLCQLVRLATRHRVEPLAVTVPSLPQDLAAYQAYFGVAPKLGKEARIEFSAEDAQRPFLTRNEAMWAQFEPGLRQSLASLDANASTVERLRSLLLEMLPAGQSGAEQAASRLAMSKRTLQRRLSSEQSNFQQVLDDTRLELAHHYLGRQQSAAEVAFLLGYQDTTSFYRAFQAWTGTTPERYRQAH